MEPRVMVDSVAQSDAAEKDREEARSEQLERRNDRANREAWCRARDDYVEGTPAE